MYLHFKQPKRSEFYGKFRLWTPLTLAAILSLLLHLCGLLILPERIFKFEQPLNPAQQAPLDLTLSSPQVHSPPEQYAEVNPDVAENKPDRADAYSFKDQQAAGESGLDPDSKMPQVHGALEAKKLLQNDHPLQQPAQPSEIAHLIELGPQAETSESIATPDLLPPLKLPSLPDFLKAPETSQARGANDLVSDTHTAAQVVPDPKLIELYAPNAHTTVAEDSGTDQTAAHAVDRPQPSVRPRLSPDILAGPQMQSDGGRVRRGTLAMDASFSEFGEYEQQFYSALQAGWYQEIDFFQPIDTATRVVIQFVLQADGVIRDIEVLSSNASRIASLLCQNALSKRSPFRVWTREMVETFGEARQMRVVFHYR